MTAYEAIGFVMGAGGATVGYAWRAIAQGQKSQDTREAYFSRLVTHLAERGYKVSTAEGYLCFWAPSATDVLVMKVFEASLDPAAMLTAMQDFPTAKEWLRNR